MFKSIRWRIAVPYVVLILLVMAGLAFYLSNLVRDAYLDGLRTELRAKALVIQEAVGAELVSGAEAVDARVRYYADLLDVRVTIIRADGLVLGESHTDRTQMDNHLYRPEVQQSLGQGEGQSIRYSRTMGYDMMYVALPLVEQGEVVGFVRVALSLQQIEAGVAQLRSAVLLATLLAAVLAMLLALFIAGSTSRPVRQLTQVSERMAAGDLGARLFPMTQDEVGQLTRAFNRMADHLQEQMATLARERSRLEAVMSHMADGVIITDGRGTVLLVNPTAIELLDIPPERAVGASFAQAVRHHQLIDLWQQCQESSREQSELVEMSHQGLFLQVIVTPFREADRWGFLVILQDLTRIRRLETVRRDFISNISHELRTPLASLKALVDTLRDGALDDPPAAERFLNRVETEVDAMNQMVQELLELSRIESGRVPLERRPVPVADLLVSPVERLRPQAERAGLQLDLEMPADLPEVWADAGRIRQVVTNLVHNAIKFTPPGGFVAVRAGLLAGDLVVSVQDSGVGIPADDLPRIFERFYKAERARSGGGTGLGLAISKHIVQAHQGEIWAESVEGQGSTFFFSLPLGVQVSAL